MRKEQREGRSKEEEGARRRVYPSVDNEKLTTTVLFFCKRREEMAFKFQREMSTPTKCSCEVTFSKAIL